MGHSLLRLSAVCWLELLGHLTFSLAFPLVALKGTANSKLWLFPFDKGCVCIKTTKETPSAIAVEQKIAGTTYQIFHSRSDSKRELFRIDISDDWAGEWNYGIANEADINDDGKADYSWYGGDDTGDEEYIFLSNGDSYRKIDIHKTFEAAWRRRFSIRTPDLGDLDDDCHLNNEVLERTTIGLILLGQIRCQKDYTQQVQRYNFRVQETDFVE